MQQANHRSRGLTKTHRLVSSSRSQPASTSQPAQTVIRTPIQTAEPPRSGHSTFRPILSWAAYLIIIITVHPRHALQAREARAGSIVFRWHREPWSHRAVAVADRPLAACFWLKLRKRRQASLILTEATVSAVAEVPCLYARWTSMESRWVTMATRSDEPDTTFAEKKFWNDTRSPALPIFPWDRSASQALLFRLRLARSLLGLLLSRVTERLRGAIVLIRRRLFITEVSSLVRLRLIMQVNASFCLILGWVSRPLSAR
jgi:hypothetical protein